MGRTAAGRRKDAPPVAPDDASAARDCALAILSGAAQSADALKRRLERRGFDTATAAAAVAEMRGYGYVDDIALAASIARRRRAAGFGQARIAADLRRRGVEDGAIDEALGELAGADDVALAREVAQRSRRAGPDAGREERERDRRRIAGLLQRRGFPGEVIGSVLRSLDGSGPDEAEPL